MVCFRISRAALLKKTVSLLNKLPEPGVITIATFNFSPAQGMSLLASSHDDHVLGAIRIDVGSFNRFFCDRPCSLAIDINHLCTFLNYAGDEHYLHMVTSDSENRYFFNIEDSEGKIIQERCMALNYKVNEVHRDFDQTPHEYVVKVAIPTLDFTKIIKLFADFEFDTIWITVTNKKVTFTDGCHKVFINNEQNELIVEGVKEDDHGSYVAKFNWTHLRSLDDSIRLTRSVWIYPSNGNGSPSVLKCPIDSNPIGTVMYYFLSQDD